MMNEIQNGNSAAVAAIRPRMSAKNFILKYNAPVMLIVLVIISTILSPYFLTMQNVANVLRQQSVYILIAMGSMLVIMSAGIDLSVTAVATLGSLMTTEVLTTWQLDGVFGGVLAVVCSIGIGVAFGVISGALISYLKMAPFIVTMGMATIGEGLAFWITNGTPIRLMADKNAASDMFVKFGQGSVFGLPTPIILVVLILVVLFIVMKYTLFGRMIVATGSNATAVRLAGINERKYIFLAYVICGALSGLAGFIITARAGVGAPQSTSSDYSLSCIAACLIGGCSFEGGKGSVSFVLIGVFIVALITNIMNLLSVAPYPQLMIKGVIIILCVLLRSLDDMKAKKG